MENKKVEHVLKLANKAFTSDERSNAETLWADLAEYILPNQNGGFFGNTTKAKRHSSNVFKSEPGIFNRDLSNAVHSTITNPAMEWSKIAFKNEELNKDQDGIVWRQNATKEIHHMLSDSNFDGSLGETYQSLFALGTFVLFHEEITENGRFTGCNFQPWHLSQVAMSENHLGDVDTIYRKYKMTLRNIVEKFGEEACGEEICSKAEKNPENEELIYLCISPRDPKDVELNSVGLAPPKSRPYQALYILERGKRLLKEDGYYEFPVYVNRVSKLPGEVYGYGPGHAALADILGLNAIQRDDLVALAKATNPPMVALQGGVISADLRPSHITYVNDMDSFTELKTQARFDVTDSRMDRILNTLKSAFYIDKLMLPPRNETGEMTAYEISQRLEQMQTVLGPILSRLNYEFLTPLVVRSLKILMRVGKIPPLPESIISKLTSNGTSSVVDFQLTFVNSLARSQQMSELRNVQTWLQETSQLAQVRPEVLDNINPDAVLEYSAKIRDIPASFLLPQEVVQQIRQQRQQAQQAQAALQAAGQVGDIAKNMGGQNSGG